MNRPFDREKDLERFEKLAHNPNPVVIPDMAHVTFLHTAGGIQVLDDGQFLFQFCLPALPFVKFYIPFDRESLIAFMFSIERALDEAENSEATTT